MREQNKSTGSQEKTKEKVPERNVLWKLSLMGTILVLAIALYKILFTKQ